MPKADAYIFEAKALWEEGVSTNSLPETYNKLYLKSKHWDALHEDVRARRPEKCEFCGIDRTASQIHLHHLKYESWYDVKIFDLLWLCEKHHNIVHQHIEPPKKGASTFLAIDTMRILAQNAINEVESSKELLKIELANAAAQFNKLEQRQKATQGLAVKRSGFPIWLTGVLTVGALAIGVFIGAVVVRPDFESPSTEQAP